jgi:hypothetical protein
MSKTLLCHTLTKNIFDIVVDCHIFIHFHFMKIHRSPLSRQEQNIFRQDLGIGIWTFCNESGRFGAVKSDSTHYFFGNACTKSGSLRFPSFPVVNWFCLFMYVWVLTFPLEDCTEFGNFVITLIYWNEHIVTVMNIYLLRWTYIYWN